MTKEEVRKRKRRGFEVDAWVYQGQRFTFGVVSTLDGEIEQVINYKRAEQCGFHHQIFVRPGLREDTDNNLALVFWFENGQIQTWNGELIGITALRILQQVEIFK